MSSQAAGNRRIKRRSIPQALTASLRERILNGEIKEGETLIQGAIAQEYDTSRMAVREALRQLEAEGLVVMHLHRGAVVTSLPTEQIAELFQLRALLEGEVLRIAIPRLTDEHLAGARTILKDLEGAYQRRHISSWGRLNWDFHRTLYGPADRIQTLSVLQGINFQTDRYIRLHLLLTRAVAQAEKEHRELLQLCKAREVEGAVAFLKEHILGTQEALLAAIEKNRAREARS